MNPLKLKSFSFFLTIVLSISFVSSALAFTGPGAGQQPGSGGGILFSSSTNIGIGTASPSQKLEVSGGNIKIDNGKLYLYSSEGPLISFDTTNGILINADASSPGNQFNLQAWNGSAVVSRLKIDANGNVGIATTTPGYPLTVVGNVWSSGSFIGTLSGSLSAANVSGPSAFGTNYGTYNYAMPGALAVGTTTVTGLQANSLFVNGNVGIGTTSPGYKLVATTAANGTQMQIGSNGYFSDWNGSLYYGAGGTFGTTGTWTARATSASVEQFAGGQVTWAADTNLTIGNTFTPTNRMTLGTTGNLSLLTGILTVSGTGNSSFAGNVGIGTSTPQGLLDIYSAASNSDIYLSSGSNDWRMVHAATDNTFRIQYNLANNLTINTSGNVGIATTTPQYKLSVSGSYYSVEIDKGSSGAAITIDWSAGNTQHVILTSGPATPVAFTFSNPQPGARYTLVLKQDGTGGRTVTWPATVRFGSAGQPTLSTAINITDYVGFQYNGVDGKYDNVAFNAGF